MLKLAIDSKGELRVRWPEQDEAWIALGRSYVAHERDLKAAQRCPVPALKRVAAALERAEQALDRAAEGETARARGSESYRKALDEAVPLLETSLVHLKSRWAENLAGLGAWGLKTKAGKKGVKVLRPASRKEWAEFLQRYVEREHSLPTKERLAEPALARLSALADAVRDGRQSRAAGRTQRGTAVRERTEAVRELSDLLQVGAAALVCSRLDGRVGRELEAWGYTVSGATKRASAAEAAAAADRSEP